MRSTTPTLKLKSSTTPARHEWRRPKKSSWFDGHHRCHQLHPTSGLQMNQSNISPNTLEYDGKSKGQKQARERRNKLKEGRRRRARQWKGAWVKYESDLAEYNKRKSELEAEERRATNTPYNKIWEALEELKAISHPNEEQVQLQEVLRTTALKAHDGRTRSKLPARSSSHGQRSTKPKKVNFRKAGTEREPESREKKRPCLK
jgi:hypothetical protein